jgi:hypothetical protein
MQRVGFRALFENRQIPGQRKVGRRVHRDAQGARELMERRKPLGRGERVAAKQGTIGEGIIDAFCNVNIGCGNTIMTNSDCNKIFYRQGQIEKLKIIIKPKS